MIILKEIFEAVRAALAESGSFETVQYWNNQTENEQQELAYRRPAAFIEIADPEVIPHLQALPRYTRQDAVALRVVIHVEVETYTDVNTSFNEVCDLLQIVRRVLHGVTADSFTPLRFNGFEPENDGTNKIVWQISFVTQGTITGEEKGFNEIDPEDITLTVNKQMQISNYQIRTDEPPVED